MAQYKQFMAGLAVGVIGVSWLVWMSSLGTEPFQSVPYIVRDVKGDTLFRTPKFTILYRGVGGVNCAGGMTVAGRNDGLSSLWNGGSSGSGGGSEKGITSLSLYDEDFGIATFFVAGQIFRIKENATKLEVADSTIDLSSTPFVIVDKSKRARVANGSESKVILASIGSDDLEYNTTASAKR